MATRNGAEAFGIDAGVIAEGKLADAILVRLDDERMQPLHHLVSNWVYAADSHIVDTVICDGRIILEHREFPQS
jgi:5-methylthioadenosine/S-adenosylhomocysteine deaminase